MTLGDCADGDVVRLGDGELASISWRSPLTKPVDVFVRILDPLDGTRSDPRPMRATTLVAEVVDPAPVRNPGAPDPDKHDDLDPVLRGPARQGALL